MEGFVSYSSKSWARKRRQKVCRWGQLDGDIPYALECDSIPHYTSDFSVKLLSFQGVDESGVTWNVPKSFGSYPVWADKTSSEHCHHKNFLCSCLDSYFLLPKTKLCD